MAIFPSYHVPLKLTMPHTVITKRGKKPMRTGPGHRCPHASTAPVNPHYGRLSSDTELIQGRVTSQEAKKKTKKTIWYISYYIKVWLSQSFPIIKKV